MFSVEQKRNIANSVQQILRDTGHPELPTTEIEFMLFIHGRFQWAWAVIQNNSAVPIPSINPWNEAQVIPAESRYGREPCKACKGTGEVDDTMHSVQAGMDITKPCPACKPDKVKPLAQFLSGYLNAEQLPIEQALDAYQSTENVTIKIERNVR